MRPWMSETRAPGYGATTTWLAGRAQQPQSGRRAAASSATNSSRNPTTNNNWDFRLIDCVELDSPSDRTHVTWKRGLGSVTPYSNPPLAPQVYVLRKRAAVFGTQRADVGAA